MAVSLRRLIFFVLFVLFLCMSVFSCKDEVPGILDIRFKVVFDFPSYGDPPETYAMLFLQPSTDVDFAAKIVLRHIQSGYEWHINEPSVLWEGETAWVGSAHLVNPGIEGTALFPQGNFLLRYIDTSERESETTLTLVYPTELEAARADGAAELLPPSSAHRFALYDSEERLVYFGEKRRNWLDFYAIQRDIPRAAYSRECISTPGYAAVVVLPMLQGSAE
jgi:hypothetical protein